MKKIFLVLILLISCFISSKFAQTEVNLHTLRGIVKIQDSGAISALRMVFKSSAREVLTFSDINGEFDVSLAPGRYELTVSKTISSEFVAFIDIQENGLNPNFIEFVIETNPNSCGASINNSCPKLIKLDKPFYPPAARAVRAIGEVVVGVKIDKAGNIISAKAESGHPLLRAISEQAAMKSVFESSENVVEREVKLLFVFLLSDSEEKEAKRYSSPYRIEIFHKYDVILDTRDT